MTTEAEKRWEQAKARLESATERVVGLARAMADDYRKGHAPHPETMRRLCELTTEEIAAQAEVHAAGMELIAALEPRKARA